MISRLFSGSWRTTLAGALGAAAIIAASVRDGLSVGDDWLTITGAVLIALAAYVARDDGVRSEESGAVRKAEANRRPAPRAPMLGAVILAAVVLAGTPGCESTPEERFYQTESFVSLVLETVVDAEAAGLIDAEDVRTLAPYLTAAEIALAEARALMEAGETGDDYETSMAIVRVIRRAVLAYIAAREAGDAPPAMPELPPSLAGGAT